MITNKVNEYRKIKGQQEHTWLLGYVNETTLRLLGKKNSTTWCGKFYQNANAAQRLETRKPLKDFATARKSERITAFQYFPFT